MRWFVMALAAGLAACATEEPLPEPRPAASAARPGTRPPPRPPAARPAPPAEPAAVAPAEQADTPWRAARDGITACPSAATLRLMREAGDGDLRRLAATRAAGGCVTVFRATAWRLAESGEGMVRLAPSSNGAPLWFWRDEVTEERL